MHIPQHAFFKNFLISTVALGVELIRKKSHVSVFAITTPLITRADGSKFGKTASAFTLAETLETTKIYSIMGLLTYDRGLLPVRPFRTPHHTISNVALVGGGSFPHPGEISLHGICCYACYCKLQTLA